MNKKLVIVFAAVILLGAAAAGGALWYLGKPAAAAGNKPAKYVSLDKVIVMLKRAPNEGTTHYLSTDLVLDHRRRRRKADQGTPAAAAQRSPCARSRPTRWRKPRP
jgi:flagellar FliL protein